MSRSDHEDDWIDEVQHREGFVLDEVSLLLRSNACPLAHAREHSRFPPFLAASRRAVERDFVGQLLRQ